MRCELKNTPYNSGDSIGDFLISISKMRADFEQQATDLLKYWMPALAPGAAPAPNAAACIQDSGSQWLVAHFCSTFRVGSKSIFESGRTLPNLVNECRKMSFKNTNSSAISNLNFWAFHAFFENHIVQNEFLPCPNGCILHSG